MNAEGQIVDDEGNAATGYVVAGDIINERDTVSDCNENNSSADVSFINSTSTGAAHSGSKPGPSNPNYAIPRPTESFANITEILKIFDPTSAQPTSSADTSVDFITKEDNNTKAGYTKGFLGCLSGRCHSSLSNAGGL